MLTHKKRIRRNHSPALKAQILAECAQPGASVAQVAMSHGINANIVHGWRKLARQSVQPVVAVAGFVPVRIAPPVAAPAACLSASAPRIDIELHSGPVSVHIAWPVLAVAEMAPWLREVLRGESSS